MALHPPIMLSRLRRTPKKADYQAIDIVFLLLSVGVLILSISLIVSILGEISILTKI